MKVIVDERSAAFFALGAAQASGHRSPPTPREPQSPTTTRRCEADESGLPLVVLSADRPPELRGIGAGQTIDQVKPTATRCAGSAKSALMRRTTTVLHYRSVACRALAAARGETHPVPSTSTCPGASRWRRSAVEGAVTRDRSAGAGGPRGTTADRGDADRLEPSEFLLDEMAAASATRSRGDRRRPPARPGAARAARPLARASGFPIFAEPTSQLRCGPHDRSRVVAELRPAAP